MFGRSVLVVACLREHDALENLAWGTRADNYADAIRNGVQMGLPGEKNGNARITETDVLAIRAARANGVSIKSLAEQYGMHYQHMFRIVHRKRWSHV